MDKECRKCRAVKPAAQFYMQALAKDGLQSYCIPCAKEAAAKASRRSDRRLKAKKRLASLKLIIGCQDCGYRDDPLQLHFDHLPGYKKLFNVSQGSDFNRRRLAREMMKCDVVCAPCHRRRTAVLATVWS